MKVVCRGVLLGCARPLFPGEKRTFSAMGWVFASKIAPKMTPVKKARKSNSMKVVPDKEVDEPLAPRHNLLSTPSVELVLNGGRSSTTIGWTRSGSCCPDLRQRLGRSLCSSAKLSCQSAQIWCGHPECQSTLKMQGPGGGYGKGSNRADPARQGKVIASAPSHTKK